MFSLFCASLLCLQQATSFAFLASPHQLIKLPMARFAEEKKDDGVLYWEAGLSDVELPSFPTRPKMIVFDKDGTDDEMMNLVSANTAVFLTMT